MTFKGMCLLVCSGVLLLGCAGKSPRTDYALDVDFSTFNTFVVQPISSKDNPLANDRIEQEIKQQLTKQGFNSTATDPDFLVTVNTLVSSKLRSSNVSVGVGTSTRLTSNSRMSANINTPVATKEVEVKTIDIRIFDPKQRLIWRGSDSYNLSKKTEKNIKSSNKSIEKILSGFPPTKTNS